MPIKALKKIPDLNYTFKPILVFIRSWDVTGHGIEFENSQIDKFCYNHGISHNFSPPRTPQQNSIAEKKNMTLVEMDRTILCESQLPKYFWVEKVNTACYILNKALIKPILRKTPYEL